MIYWWLLIVASFFGATIAITSTEANFISFAEYVRRTIRDLEAVSQCVVGVATGRNWWRWSIVVTVAITGAATSSAKRAHELSKSPDVTSFILRPTYLTQAYYTFISLRMRLETGKPHVIPWKCISVVCMLRRTFFHEGVRYIQAIISPISSLLLYFFSIKIFIIYRSYFTHIAAVIAVFL